MATTQASQASQETFVHPMPVRPASCEDDEAAEQGRAASATSLARNVSRAQPLRMEHPFAPPCQACYVPSGQRGRSAADSRVFA